MAKAAAEAQRLIKILSEHARAIPVDGATVSILETPAEYFNTLLDGISMASQRLLIASLYCGIGPGREGEFVEALAQKLGSADPIPTTEILLDALRGSRPSKGPTGEDSSSAVALSEMLRPEVRVSLFHTPALRGLLKRMLPPRVNEVVGVSHIKAYVFDDDVLMSGANLSSDYFTIRQDRYMMFKSCPQLASWLHSMMQEVGRHSYSLQPGVTLATPLCGHDPIRKPGSFRKSLRRQLEAFWQPTPHSSAPAAEGEHEGHGAQQDSGIDTWIFPSMQLGSVGLMQDERMTSAFIRAAAPGGKLTLSSPYLNLARPFKQALGTNTEVDVTVLTASPEANGFFGAKGAAGFIPLAYGMLQRSNWKYLSSRWKRGKPERPSVCRKLLEYKRSGWQFHAKGIWYTPPGSDLPIAATIGSPNFGYRSVHRDLECQLFLVTLNPALRQALADEMEGLSQHCSDISQEQLERQQPPSPYRLRLLARLMRSFL